MAAHERPVPDGYPSTQDIVDTINAMSLDDLRRGMRRQRGRQLWRGVVAIGADLVRVVRRVRCVLRGYHDLCHAQDERRRASVEHVQWCATCSYRTTWQAQKLRDNERGASAG